MEFFEQAAPPADHAAYPTVPADDGAGWSTWEGATHGPRPRPEWVITDPDAREFDRGVLKTGKEADVHLVERFIPGGHRSSLMAAKRYRGAEHRLFHRDAGYLEGRRVRKSRETRAMSRRTEFGKSMIAGLWAGAEFTALCRLWEIGLPVPYPVQHTSTELLMEFVGSSEGVGAPRLAALRPDPALARELFEQWRAFQLTLAGVGWAHGDLSPYNVLIHDERLVVIDWPQIVDVVGNPQGLRFLERDVRTMCAWFGRHGVECDEENVVGDVLARAAARW